MLKRPAQMIGDRVFYQSEPLLIGNGLTQTFAEPFRRRTPKRLKIDVRIGKLAGSRSEKRKCTTGFEMNTHDEHLFVPVGYKPSPIQIGRASCRERVSIS